MRQARYTTDHTAARDCDECGRLAALYGACTDAASHYAPRCTDHTDADALRLAERTPDSPARPDGLRALDAMDERRAYAHVMAFRRTADRLRETRDRERAKWRHGGADYRRAERRAFDAALTARELWTALLDRAGLDGAARLRYADHLRTACHADHTPQRGYSAEFAH